jgi:hypothetical protein
VPAGYHTSITRRRPAGTGAVCDLGVMPGGVCLGV